MLDSLKFLGQELIETALRPRIEKAKVDLKMAIVTTLVVILFALLAMMCLFLFIYLRLAAATSPAEAAMILFGFSLFMCAGAIVVHAIGKKVEQRAYEDRLQRPLRRLNEKLPARENFDMAKYAQDMFADNKASALIAATVAGIVIGVRPALVFRTVSKLFLGAKRNERDKRRGRR